MFTPCLVVVFLKMHLASSTALTFYESRIKRGFLKRNFMGTKTKMCIMERRREILMYRFIISLVGVNPILVLITPSFKYPFIILYFCIFKLEHIYLF